MGPEEERHDRISHPELFSPSPSFVRRTRTRERDFESPRTCPPGPKLSIGLSASARFPFCRMRVDFAGRLKIKKKGLEGKNRRKKDGRVRGKRVTEVASFKYNFDTALITARLASLRDILAVSCVCYCNSRFSSSFKIATPITLSTYSFRRTIFYLARWMLDIS